MDFQWGFVNFMKVMFCFKNYFGIIYAMARFWHQKFSLRNNDNFIANEGNAENMIEAYIGHDIGHVVEEYS